MRVTPGAPNRAHLLSPQEWGYAVGTDFWLMPSANGMLTAGVGHELSDYGWTTTSLVLASGSAGDFLSLTDIGAGSIATNAASDLLLSPALFGGGVHAWAAGQILGFTPTRLNLECYAAFTAVAGNETATGFGFVEDGGSPIVADDALAMIISNGTNFILRSGAASDTGAAVDTSVHKWRITITSGGSVEWFIDGVSQGTIAIEADEWPVAFGLGQQAAGTNTLAMTIVHIWYD